MDESSNCSNSSLTSTFTDDSIVGTKIIEEEKRLILENEKTKEESSCAYDLEVMKTEEELADEREAEIIKERRYKKLMHLLNNSKMYSLILKERIQQDKVSAKKKDGNTNRQNKKESSQNKKNLHNGSYKVGDIITEEKIDENVALMEESPQLQVEEDFFRETRVTELGFTVSCKQPILLEGASMRDYQLKGLEWLKNLFLSGVNGILADEMGLGKTLQAISLVCYMIEQDIRGPFLIIAPLSTISNWMSEFRRFAPKVPVMLYHGTEEERRSLLPEIFRETNLLDKSSLKVVITSYQVPLRDRLALEKINWHYLIVDEGHRIKNHNSQLSRTLRQFNAIGRLLLTGTPLQNDLSELWSLLNFLLPEIFNTLDVFVSWFDIKELESNGERFMEEKSNVDVVRILQEILQPFLLRREKKDVNLQLPPKKEVLIYCPMTSRQKELYQSMLDRSIELLVKPYENVVDVCEPLPKRRCFLNSPYGKQNSEPQVLKPVENHPKQDKERFVTNLVLQNPQMLLRKIVNHPYLIQFPLKTGTEELRIDEDLVKESGKLLILDALLSKLKARGHKVVVFSYFKILLDILEEHAIMRGYKYCRMDGHLKRKERDEEIFKFISDPETFVFYITIRSGGLGINLTAADTVIFYDSDWNPQVNLQSQDRCHRIGQTKPVVIYRLCTKGTVDEKIMERGNAKRRLEKMILQKGKFNQNSRNINLIDLKELRLLMESTDHDIEINSNGFILTDEELDELLDRSDMTDGSVSQ